MLLEPDALLGPKIQGDFIHTITGNHNIWHSIGYESKCHYDLANWHINSSILGICKLTSKLRNMCHADMVPKIEDQSEKGNAWSNQSEEAATIIYNQHLQIRSYNHQTARI